MIDIYWYNYPKKLILFQTKPNINSATGGILCFEGERTVAETLYSVRQKRLERKTGGREEGHLQTQKASHHIASLTLYPSGSHHILAPLLFKVRY